MMPRLLISSITVLAVLFSASTVLAAPYGSGKYGDCPYQVSCTVTPAPNDPDPTPMDPAPEPGDPEPDTSPSPEVVASDIDNDGNEEQALDADGNPANGYEQFTDPDGSTQVLAMTDGEHDGTATYILDTNGDGVPDIYWSPSSQYSAFVTVRDDDTGVAWMYVNSKGQMQVYYVSLKSPARNQEATVTPTKQHRITPDNFGGAAYQKVGELVKKIPAPVAHSFPYLLLLLIAILIIRLILQAKREIARIQVIRNTAEREKQLVLEKQNFLMLASHYLRTPLTVIAGNIELLQSLKSIPDPAAIQLTSTTAAMRTESEKLLKDLSKNPALSEIATSSFSEQNWRKALISPFVIGPFVALSVLILLLNFIFADFGVTRPSMVDILIQILLLAILTQWGVSSVRKRHINRQNRLDQQHVLDSQRQLDLARSNFIKGSTKGLSEHINTFEQQLVSLSAAGVDVSRIRKGFDQLKEIITKFLFASNLEAVGVASSKIPFDSSKLIESVTARGKEKAATKQIVFESRAQGGRIVQNQPLLGVVLDSLVDNAIKYSKDHGTVQLGQSSDNNATKFAVQDQGQGLTTEQLDMLFKPFSRTESAETFNTEGLGFSLYLDKLIMHYLGGDISINSSPGQGTRAELDLPKA